MKEIKAYIRRDEVDQVVERLESSGAPGISIIEIHPIGYGYEPNVFQPLKAGLVQRYRYLTIVKLEMFCADNQLERLLQVIRDYCCTGNPGDGMIFVSEVVEAVRIRDGVRGDSALRPARATERTPTIA